MNQKGVYSELAPVDKLNFYVLLRTDFEKQLCEKYLFVYESVLDELKCGLLGEAVNVLNIKINTPKLFRFLVDLSNLFSKYYNKIHVLEVIELFQIYSSTY